MWVLWLLVLFVGIVQPILVALIASQKGRDGAIYFLVTIGVWGFGGGVGVLLGGSLLLAAIWRASFSALLLGASVLVGSILPLIVVCIMPAPPEPPQRVRRVVKKRRRAK